MPITDRIRKSIESIAKDGKNVVNEPENRATRKAVRKVESSDALFPGDKLRSTLLDTEINTPSLARHLRRRGREAFAGSVLGGATNYLMSDRKSTTQNLVTVTFTNPQTGEREYRQLYVNDKQLAAARNNPEVISKWYPEGKYNIDGVDFRPTNFVSRNITAT